MPPPYLSQQERRLQRYGINLKPAWFRVVEKIDTAGI
jgi:hypothetical protein